MSWFDRLPKLELHLHLEGALPHEALWELVQKYGGDPQVPDLAALERRFRYRDFAHFIETWTWKNGFIREYEDFSFLAEAVARDLSRQNIRYVEAFYSPSDFTRYGLGTQRITDAIRSGLERVPEARISLVADLVRDHGPERAASTLNELIEVRDLGVIGIGIGGNEAAFPRNPSARCTTLRGRRAFARVHTRERPQVRRAFGARSGTCAQIGSGTGREPRRTSGSSTTWLSPGSRWRCVRYRTCERESWAPWRSTRCDATSSGVCS